MRASTVLATLLTVALVTLAAAPAAFAAADRIAFVRNGDIWTIAPDGSDATRLTGGSREDASPAWSPDHKTVAFVRLPSEDDWGDTPDICTVSASGGASHAIKYKDSLAKTDFHFINSLAYSPDGKKLAFTDMYQLAAGTSQPKPEYNRLVVIDLKTRKTTVLIKHKWGFGGAIDAGWPISWSPDGKSLLISQWGMDSEGGMTQVFTIATRKLRKLPIADATWSDWAPDGDTIVVSTYTQSDSSVLIAGPTGSVIRTLVRGLGWEATPADPSYEDACYSADGDHVAYTVDPWTGDKGRSVWIMGTDGSGAHRLTSGEAPAWR